jgi:hypothetical protein
VAVKTIESGVRGMPSRLSGLALSIFFHCTPQIRYELNLSEMAPPSGLRRAGTRRSLPSRRANVASGVNNLRNGGQQPPPQVAGSSQSHYQESQGLPLAVNSPARKKNRVSRWAPCLPMFNKQSKWMTSNHVPYVMDAEIVVALLRRLQQSGRHLGLSCGGEPSGFFPARVVQVAR